jgi:broad specificity phosphatase PhoE
MKVHFLSHPEVEIDPAVPIPRWHLSSEGVARTRVYAAQLPRPAAIWASTECKAIETAGIVAAHHALPVHVHRGLDENDRSATGYLPPTEFQHAADRFFAHPEQSFRGWERAIDAQRRVVGAWNDILDGATGTLLLVGHGGTGTLLMCALANLPIDRCHDSPRQGSAWKWDRDTECLEFRWQPI